MKNVIASTFACAFVAALALGLPACQDSSSPTAVKPSASPGTPTPTASPPVETSIASLASELGVSLPTQEQADAAAAAQINAQNAEEAFANLQQEIDIDGE